MLDYGPIGRRNVYDYGGVFTEDEEEDTID